MSLRRLAIPLTLILLAGCLALTACGSDDAAGSADGLVGQWQSVSGDQGGTLEFTIGGKMIATSDDPEQGSIEFSYATDGDTILLGEEGSEEMMPMATYAIDGDTLTITDIDTGEPDVYERIK